jgi:hypothetical protein
MDEPFPTRDFLEGLRFTFRSDHAHDDEPEPTRTQKPEPRPEDEEIGYLSLQLGETPMTDPRSLGSSALVHAVLILLASFTVMTVVRPPSADGPKALRGELDPVDNRADTGKTPGEGGGSPGEIGGLGSVAFVAPATGNDPRGPGLDPAADALLHDILPSTTQPPPEGLQRALPGPQTTGVGLIPGSGTGGGGGSGGGSGGGIGRGVGPGTEFFGARETGRSFAYVIDCSGSMATRSSLDIAKRELLSSLNVLPPDAQFSVIFYNLRARVFADPNGRQGLMPATAANKTRVQNQLQTVSPEGGTDHMLALRTALGLKPEVVFFLTDGDLMTNNDVNEILAEFPGSRIQAVEFGHGPDLGENTPLRRMANTTGGSYRYIDVTKFPRSAAGY